MRVLVVDDSSTMRIIIQRSLNKLGAVNVAEAADGRQALNLLSSAKFDAILSDWNMPNMDGLELLKEFRKRDEETPFIMITTESERSRVILAIQAGVSDYLVKPFTPDDLLGKLSRWIPVGN